MSQESLTEFRTKLAADEGMQQELRESAGMGSGDAMTTGSFIEFASTKGYEFTVDEVRAADMALSDAELEGVAGGRGFMKFEGVAGESKDRDHGGWSDILSFNQALRIQ